jgi:hypothetical protein
VALQDPGLGAGGVVLRQPGDLLEQRASLRIVEILAGQPPRGVRETYGRRAGELQHRLHLGTLPS